MKFIDLFAGIGGFRLGMESAGHECVAFCEIDKFARASYKAIHDTTGEIEYHDITSVTDEEWRKFRGTVDVICGGFPCQAFSVAGKRQGFLDETRGTLFFEIARAAKQIKPRILFLENVKGLLSHDKGRTFGIILNTLDELGYDCEWQVLNSKNFGVPQNRERVFIIGHSRGDSGREVFPIRGKNATAINVINKKDKMPRETNRVYSSQGLNPTLNTMQGGGREPKIVIKIKEATKQGYAIAEQGDSVNISHPNSKTRRGRVGKQIANTLLTGEEQAVIVQKPRGYNKGGGREPKIITGQPTRIDGKRQVNYKLSDTVGTLLASQYKNGDTQPKVVIPVLTPDRAEKRQNGRRFKENGEPMFTLTAQDRHGVAVLRPVRTNYGKEIRKAYENGEVEESRHNMTKLEPRQDGISNTITTVQKDNLLKDDFRIRKLTPRECWRLQGFPDWTFDKAQEVNSNSQLYKQAGNSVTVNVIAEIAKKLEDVSDE